MADIALTPLQQEVQDLARDYANEVVKPVAHERDKIDSWEERAPWELIEEGSRRGLRTITLSEEWGGKNLGLFEICLMAEEIAVGDCGISIIFDHCWRFGRLMCASANREQQERILPEFIDDHRFIVGSTATERERGGTDNALKYDGNVMQTNAVRDGDHYVINGRKIFISNGNMARLFTVRATTDPDAPYQRRVTTFLVRRDTPGFGNGQVYRKIGSRNLINAEVIFDNVRVPVENRMGEEGVNPVEDFLASSHPEIGAVLVGIARRAYEETLAYSKQRVAGGKRIIEHQAIQLVLGQMFTQIRAARALIWEAALRVDRGDDEGARMGWAAKMFAGDVAIDVTANAVKTLGGNGVMEEYPVEKLARDALAFHHMHSTNDALRMRIARSLDDKGV